MAQERYDLQKGNWVADSQIDTKEVAEGVYSELGDRFPMQFDEKEPIVDSDDLPSGITMSDVKNALKNNHPLI